MSTSVFFSWQNDRPTREGRNSIEKALQNAIQAIHKDVTVEPAVREHLNLDRDTKGVAGTPPIFATILDKIERATVFVADLTFVAARPDGRKLTPNPNVLIEYGWALKSLGYGRIINVLNSAYGEPTSESMPFDMAGLRFPITYDVPENADDSIRHSQRQQLAKELEGALREILANDELKAKIEDQLISLIREGKALQGRWGTLLGKPNQEQIVQPISNWNKAAEEFLSTVPRGNLYLAKFQNRVNSTGMYPVGITVAIGGYWDLINSNLYRLGEFLNDSQFGKP